jgi:DNA-binding GntR family transcriptional regulator
MEESPAPPGFLFDPPVIVFLRPKDQFCRMARRPIAKPSRPSRLQADLARRILRALAEDGAVPGERLVELDLCERFGVSRTPVRGALKLLADDGFVAPRDSRGYVLAKLPHETPEEDEGEEERRLFAAMAQARADGKLADIFTQQDIVHHLKIGAGAALRLLRQLAEVGVVEKRPGNGWAFNSDTVRAINESYAFRRILEPQLLLQPTFRLDRAWAQKSRAAHTRLRQAPWRAGASAEFHVLNADFHHHLARCCGNRIMQAAVERQNQLRRYLGDHWDYPREQVYRAIDDHLEILAALESGYPDKAAALMLHHLNISGPPRRHGDD